VLKKKDNISKYVVFRTSLQKKFLLKTKNNNGMQVKLRLTSASSLIWKDNMQALFGWNASLLLLELEHRNDFTRLINKA
jgi:hypothetical protein